MSTEHRIYQGNLISTLVSLVTERKNYLRFYQLQNSAGHTFGPACEMLESEATERNRNMAEAVDYRWTVVPERGKR